MEVNKCYCEQLPDYLEVKKKVDKDVLKCTCEYIKEYADFASREKNTDDEINNLYSKVGELFWLNVADVPITSGATLEGAINTLAKLLKIGEGIDKQYDQPSRLNQVEIIETFFTMVHDGNASSVVLPCYFKNKKPLDKDFYELENLLVESLWCLSEPGTSRYSEVRNK